MTTLKVEGEEEEGEGVDGATLYHTLCLSPFAIWKWQKRKVVGSEKSHSTWQWAGNVFFIQHFGQFIHSSILFIHTLFGFWGQAGWKWKIEIESCLGMKRERNSADKESVLSVSSFILPNLSHFIAIILHKLRALHYLIFSSILPASFFFKYLALIAVIALHFLLISQRVTWASNTPLGYT